MIAATVTSVRSRAVERPSVVELQLAGNMPTLGVTSNIRSDEREDNDKSNSAAVYA
jgi:hypothetical protein